MSRRCSSIPSRPSTSDGEVRARCAKRRRDRKKRCHLRADGAPVCLRERRRVPAFAGTTAEGMNRREFLHAVAAAAAAGLPVDSRAGARALGGRFFLRRRRAVRQRQPAAFHRLPRAAPPDLFSRAERQSRRRRRERAAAASRRRVPAQAFRHPAAHARRARVHLPRLHAAARAYGRLGGFAHLATLVKKLKATRPGALLLDGGDTWQGSATALWTRGQDMVDAQKLLGVDVMTGHWEFTFGAERVKEIVDHDFAGTHRLPRAERAHRRLRRSGVSSRT